MKKKISVLLIFISFILTAICLNASDFSVTSRPNNMNYNQMGFYVRIHNNSGAAVDLNDLKLFYFYTSEITGKSYVTTTSPYNYHNLEAVLHKNLYPLPNATDIIELNFAGGTGTISNGCSSEEIEITITGASGYLDRTNDYSNNPNAGVSDLPVHNENIILTYKDDVVWGTKTMCLSKQYAIVSGGWYEHVSSSGDNQAVVNAKVRNEDDDKLEIANALMIDKVPGFENGFGEWVNTSGQDSHDWTRYSGNTPTSSTGPSSGACLSNYYMYMETSTGGANSYGNTAILEGTEIEDALSLSFYYHMYGSDIGTLNVDIYNNGFWDLGVWGKSGQQHTSNYTDYTEAVVDLSGYSGTIKVRFRATAKGGYRGDIAIDAVVITKSIEDELGKKVVFDFKDISNNINFSLIDKITCSILHYEDYIFDNDDIRITVGKGLKPDEVSAVCDTTLMPSLNGMDNEGYFNWDFDMTNIQSIGDFNDLQVKFAFVNGTNGTSRINKICLEFKYKWPGHTSENAVRLTTGCVKYIDLSFGYAYVLLPFSGGSLNISSDYGFEIMTEGLEFPYNTYPCYGPDGFGPFYIADYDVSSSLLRINKVDGDIYLKLKYSN